MKNKKDRVIPNGMNNVRMASILEEQSESMSADQVHRELVKNSMEAIQKIQKKDPDYKGKILINPYATNTPNKLSVIDNGIGMSKNNIVKLVNNFAETEEESQDGNFGHGTKIAAQCTNKEGVLYQSFRKGEDEGSAVLIKKSDTLGYGAWVNEETNEARQSLNLDQRPDLIKQYGQGTQVTLLGNFQNEDTTKPPERLPVKSLLGKGRGGERWLLSFLNTKFYTKPKNIKITVRWSPNKPDVADVQGHKYYLDKHCVKSGTLKVEEANIHWWIIKDDFNSNKTTHHLGGVGQLSFLHKGEIQRIEYNCTGRKNPLRTWGLPFTDNKVALVVEPLNFRADTKRSTITHIESGIEYTEFKTIWKEQWINNMPEEVAKFEEQKAKEKTILGEDYSNLGKRIARDLKNLYSLPGDGDISGDSTVMKTGSYLGNKKDQDLNHENKRSGNHAGNEGFGNSLLDAIIKKSSSPRKGSKTISSPNLLPNITRVKEPINGEDIDYSFNDNHLIFNVNGDLVNEYLKDANIKKPQESMAKHFLTENMIKKLLVKIAYFRGRNLNLSEEEKEKYLNNVSLKFALLDKPSLTNELHSNLRNVYKKHIKDDSVSMKDMVLNEME